MLSTIQSFLWTKRALDERAAPVRNLSACHLDVALALQKLIEAGIDEFSHAELAAAARCCIRTVGEATRRLRALGLLRWQAQYEPTVYGRRRRVNRYRLILPDWPAMPRPEQRHRRAGVICRASQESKKVRAFEAGEMATVQREALRAELAATTARREAARAAEHHARGRPRSVQMPRLV